MEHESLFRTKTGLTFHGASSATVKSMLAELLRDAGLSHLQICESASFSMAMVVRFALGLSATGGQVCALVDDCLAGWVTLAALRHLVNAGCTGSIAFVGEEKPPSIIMEQELRPLYHSGVLTERWNREEQNLEMTAHLLSCHNILCGLYNGQRKQSAHLTQIINILNEIETPVHAIEAPLGVDVDTGAVSGEPLYASSTLSLGAPYHGLYGGSDYVGRHYLCDISISQKIYEAAKLSIGGLFSEQPVLQIYPVKQEDPVEKN